MCDFVFTSSNAFMLCAATNVQQQQQQQDIIRSNQQHNPPYHHPAPLATFKTFKIWVFI
jgi:hypothetical protein